MDPIHPSPEPSEKALPPLAVAGILFGSVAVALVVFWVLIFCVGKSADSGPATVQTRTVSDRDIAPPIPPSNEVQATPATPQPAARSEAPLPWVPVYLDLPLTHGLRKEETGVVKGSFEIETSDPLDKVKEFYEKRFKAEGFEMTVDRTTTRQFEHAEIAARKGGGMLTFHAAIHQTKDRTVVTVTYEDAEHAEVTPVTPVTPSTAPLEEPGAVHTKP